ncbi:Coronin-7 [Linnemannia zychae]|nr:Coronin-7 [Linnemannia zychae]
MEQFNCGIFNQRNLTFSPSGQHIVSGHENNNSYIWDVTNGEHLRTLSGHTSSVRGIAYSSSNTNSRWIATGSIDGTVRLWNAETGNQIYVFAGHKWVVTHVAFSLDHPQIASSSYDGTIRLWDMNLTVLETTTTAIRQNGGAVSCLTYSPDGHEIFSGGRDMIVWQWDASTGNSRPLIPNYSTPIGCIAHSPKNNQIATAGYDTAVRLNKAQNGESNFELWGHYGIVSGLAFSPCGQWIASSSYDTTVKLWDTRSGEPGNILSGPVGNDSDPDTSVSGGLTCVAYSPSGHQVAAGSESGRIFIWDPRHSGQPNLVLSGHEDSIISVTFAPAGQETIASCSADKTVCIWNIQSGALLHTFHGHPEKSYCVSYSTCGNWLAAGALDGVVYLWRKDIVQSDIEQTTTATDSWSCVYTLRAFHGVVNGVTWSPTIDTSDQLEFATACDDFSVRVWKVGLKGDNGIYVSLKWGSCSGRHLIANNAVIENPENLSKANEALLLQRGAIKSSSAISVTTRTS